MFSYLPDDYDHEPERDASLIVNCDKPFNAEPLSKKLVEHYVTPITSFYKRNHAPIPYVDLDKFKLLVDGYVKTPKLYSISDIKKFEKSTQMSFLMCAGNRRNEMSSFKKVKDSAKHVQFEGLDFHLRKEPYLKEMHHYDPQNDPNFKHYDFNAEEQSVTTYIKSMLDFHLDGYGSSIPLEKALNSEPDAVLLCWEMDGQELTPEHGYPLRIIVPNYIGARSVKWVWRITLSPFESDNFYQQRDYKLLPPHVDWGNVDEYWDKCPAIQELIPQSAICSVRECSTNQECYDEFKNVCILPSEFATKEDSTKEFHLIIKGYALSFDQSNLQVWVSLDDGHVWIKPECERKGMSAWVLWTLQATLDLKHSNDHVPKNVMVKCQNIDENGKIIATQPKDMEKIWNLRGVMNNVIHTVPIKLEIGGAIGKK